MTNQDKKNKYFEHEQFEKNYFEKWTKEEISKVGDLPEDAKKYYSLYSFPYPSGAGLHVGHVEGMVANDIMARFHKMNGYYSILPMGWDAFGLPAENYAIKTGVHPKQSTDEAIGNFIEQINRLGLMVDWDREAGSHRPDYYKWTQWFFAELYKHGLAYKAKSPVNWCPKDQTVLANEQVVDGKCERCDSEVEKKDMDQWFFKITEYADRLVQDLDGVDWPDATKLQQKNWIGKSEGARATFKVQQENQKVLFATSNSGKVKRIKHLFELAGLEINVETPDSLGIGKIDVEENGSLLDNAHDKAKVYFGKTNLPIVAVDTGLFINGESLDPVKVKRNALDGVDESTLTQEQIAQKMQGFYKNIAIKNGGKVDAYFIDAVVVIFPDGEVKKFEAKREIEITDTQKGELDIYLPINSIYKCKPIDKYYSDMSESDLNNWLSPFANGLIEIFTSDLEIFTTRPDTMFGATFMVIAPEHKVISNSNLAITNLEEINEYITTVKNKTDLERTDLNKDKSGVEIKGIKAINPLNGKKLPIFVADYVLGGYGTGAIMAVPAHDERDFEFAKKYNIEIVPVIESDDYDPHIEGVFKPLTKFKKIESLEDIDATNLIFITFTTKDKQAIFSKQEHINVIAKSFINTAYKHKLNLIEGVVMDDHVHLLVGVTNEFIANNCNEDGLEMPLHSKIYKLFKGFSSLNFGKKFDLSGQPLWEKGGMYEEVNDDEGFSRVIDYIKYNPVKKNLKAKRVISDLVMLFSGLKTTVMDLDNTVLKEGQLINSDKFNGKDWKNAKLEITKYLTELGKGKAETTYRLRDWLISRQRYWGAPIPIIWKERKNPDKVLALHGYYSNSDSVWLPFLKEKLTNEMGIAEFTSPNLPNSDKPSLSEWLNVINSANLTEASSIVTHSMSGYVALKYAESHKLKQLVLVAPIHKADDQYWQEQKRLYPEYNVSELRKNYYTEDIQADKICQNVEEIVFIFSVDDPDSNKYCLEEFKKQFGQYTNVEFKTYLKKGHFDDRHFPELLEYFGPKQYRVLDTKDLPLELPMDVDFIPKGYSPLSRSEEYTENVRNRFGQEWTPEYDTMDTFVCSSWYFFRFLDPKNSEQLADSDNLNKWMPVDLYMIGAEHIVLHLMYARFFTKFLYDLGIVKVIEPFQKMRHMGIISGPDGRKMSKRWGNVINPNDVVDKYGADTLRMYEMFMGPLDQAKAWNDSSVQGVRRFIDRIYFYAHSVTDSGVEKEEDDVVTELNRLIKKITDDTKVLKFNTAVSEFMKFLNFIEPRKIHKSTFETFLILIAPYAPFISDVIWREIFGHTESIHIQTWPGFDEKMLAEQIIEIGVQVMGKSRGTIKIKPDTNQEEAVTIALQDQKIGKYLENGYKKVIYVQGRILNFVV